MNDQIVMHDDFRVIRYPGNHFAGTVEWTPLVAAVEEADESLGNRSARQ